MQRSFLFVPATDERRLVRAHERGADAIILDLEDAVAPDAKQQARASMEASVQRLAGAIVWVRINSLDSGGAQDITAIAHAGIAGVVAPKIATAAQARDVGEKLRAAGINRFMALIESAQGVLNAPSIAAEPTVSALALGSEDFAAELGAAPDEESLDLPVRSLVLAGAAAGKPAFAAAISIGEFRDLGRYRAALAKARRIGAAGVLCIHPDQVRVANEVFAPTAAELEQARAIVAAWDEAQRRGEAVASHGGRMIDLPVVMRARRLIAAVPG